MIEEVDIQFQRKIMSMVGDLGTFKGDFNTFVESNTKNLALLASKEDIN